jgi:hypothetical protein
MGEPPRRLDILRDPIGTQALVALLPVLLAKRLTIGGRRFRVHDDSVRARSVRASRRRVNGPESPIFELRERNRADTAIKAMASDDASLA